MKAGLIQQVKRGVYVITNEGQMVLRENPNVDNDLLRAYPSFLAWDTASKGLFITTAGFSDGAKSFAEKQRIALVDGRQLTRLMIEYGLGLSTVATYEIKRLDSDFFSDDE